MGLQLAWSKANKNTSSVNTLSGLFNSKHIVRIVDHNHKKEAIKDGSLQHTFSVSIPRDMDHVEAM